MKDTEFLERLKAIRERHERWAAEAGPKRARYLQLTAELESLCGLEKRLDLEDKCGVPDFAVGPEKARIRDELFALLSEYSKELIETCAPGRKEAAR